MKKLHKLFLWLFLGLAISSCSQSAQSTAQGVIDAIWDEKIVEAQALFTDAPYYLSQQYFDILTQRMRTCSQKPVVSLDWTPSESLQVFDIYVGTKDVGTIYVKLINGVWYISSAIEFWGCQQ